MRQLIRATFLILAFWSVCHSTTGFAQVSLDRFFPPVIASGGKIDVAAEGKFPNWPVKVFCDRDDLTISAAEKSGSLAVVVDDDAAPGVAWIRLYDERSASSLIPLLISPIAVTSETEPNNQSSEANALSMPAIVAGRLQKSGDCDVFRVPAVAGKALVVSLTANQILKSPMDAVLQVTDLQGNILAQSDDDRGLDPQIVYEPASDQELLVRVFAFPETPNSTIGFSGSASYTYALTVTSGPFLDHVATAGEELVPFGFNLAGTETVTTSQPTAVAPSTGSIQGALGWDWIEADDQASAVVYRDDLKPLEPPASVSGHLSAPDEHHLVTVIVKQGVKYRAEVRSKARGFLVDSELTIFDVSSGDRLAKNDDASRGNYDAGVDFTAKADGEVQIRLQELLDGSGPRHFYRMNVGPVVPAFSITVAADQFSIPSEKPLEIPVTIERDSGFNGKIRISATGLPDGVTAEPVISEPKGDSSKSVKLTFTAAATVPLQASFRLIGTELHDDGQTGAERPATFELRPAVTLADFWLTVLPSEPSASKKDN